LGSRSWAILTGEYPPQPGGVSDYTRLVARGLAAAGDSVHVWAPPANEDGEPDGAGVHVHRLPGRYGARSLRRLTHELDALSGPLTILVQYVPHAFGWKAMNLPFCLWLSRQARSREIWTVFHEVRFPIRRGQPLRHSFLGLVTSGMARLVSRASARRFVTTESWRPLFPGGADAELLGVPSTVASHVPQDAVSSRRARCLAGGARVLIGHFGTYGNLIAERLEPILERLLQSEGATVALVGRGSEAFAERFRAGRDLCDRIHAAGDLGPDEVGVWLSACDVVVQPYADGVTARRTSTMASLALGVPVVTNQGPLTERFWREDSAVALVNEPSPTAFAEAVESLTRDPVEHARIAAAGRALYDRRFALARIIETLRREPGVGLA
jgi:glycosyltransferase involved in cell wall biosynthesis